jgi:hypothetical protein
MMLSDYQAQALQLIRERRFVEPSWQPLKLSEALTVFITGDALKLVDPDVSEEPFRVCLDARTAQAACDICGWLLLTDRLIDEVYIQAHRRVTPTIQPPDQVSRVAQGYSPNMGDVEAMLRHSRDVDDKVAGYPGLVLNVGKHWFINSLLAGRAKGAAFNKGWYDKSAPFTGQIGERMWQTGVYDAAPGTMPPHNWYHVDYSQVFRPVHQWALLNGAWVQLAPLLEDDRYVELLTYQEAMEWRYPNYSGVTEPETPVDPEGPTHPPPAQIKYIRTLRVQSPYMRGDDVRQLQEFYRSYQNDDLWVDGIYGNDSASETRTFQSKEGLAADGIAGPATFARVNEILAGGEPLEPPPPPEGLPDIAFKQARNYTWGRTEAIRVIVMHSAEIDEISTSAEALMNWSAGPNAAKSSWHYAVDNNSITQSVKEKDTAWHAPGANSYGIGIELSGYARQTREEWLDEYGQQMLHLAAILVADICARHGLPVQFLSADDLQNNSVLGITTHAEVTKAFGKSTHIDPGRGFPMDWFLDKVREVGA